MKTKTNKLLLLTIAMIALNLASCTFEEPTLPQWYTEWRIPVPNPGFIMIDAVNDSTIIDTTDQDQSIIAISIRDSSERKKISRGDMAIKPKGDKAHQNVGDVTLDSPGTEESDSISVGDLLGVPIVPGTVIDIPETTINLPPAYITFSTFEFIVDVKTGTIQIEFVNDTFLDFRAGTEISIFDSASASFVGTATFSQPISADSRETSDLVDLAGRHFSNHLRFEVELLVQGRDNYEVQQDDPGGTVQFLTTISEMTVGYAMAEIPVQEFSQQDSVSLDDQDDRIITAIIDDGKFLLEIENTLNVEANVSVELLNFYLDENYSQVMVQEYTLLPTEKDTVSIHLDDLYVTDYNNGPTPGSYIDFMKYRFSIETIPSDGMVEISEHDSVILCINVEDSVYVKQFSGDLARRTFDFDPIEQNDVIDAEGFDGSIRFEDMEMRLNFFNQIGMELQLNLDIVAYKNDKTESLKLTFDRDPIIIGPRASGEDVNSEEIIFDITNSNLVEFIEFLPQDIIIEGNAMVEGEGEVSIDNEVWSDYHIYSPFFLKIRDNAQYTSKLDSAEIDENVSDAILKGNVQQTSIILGLSNGLPIGATMKAYFSINPDDIFDETITDSSEKVIIDDIQFESGELNSDNYVDKKFEDIYMRPLSDKEILIFTNPTVFIASKVFLDDTEGDGLVKFRATDEIRANGAVQIRYRMNNEEDK